MAIDIFKEISNNYRVKIDEDNPSQKPGLPTTKFINISDEFQKLPTIHVQYVDDALYAIKFLNNDFFEIQDTDLLLVVKAILAGEYKVNTSLLTRKKSITVLARPQERQIQPERIYASSDYAKEYLELPKTFVRK